MRNFLGSPGFGLKVRRYVIMKLQFLRLAARRDLAARPSSLRRAGFTLVEIMIVVLIIGLLAMIAIPNVKRSLERARLEAIRANLHTIDSVKTMWAAENKKGGDATPSNDELAPYFNGKTFPQSVVGETYNVGRVDDPPTATLSSKLLELTAGSNVTLDGK